MGERSSRVPSLVASVERSVGVKSNPRTTRPCGREGALLSVRDQHCFADQEEQQERRPGGRGSGRQAPRLPIASAKLSATKSRCLSTAPTSMQPLNH